MKLIEAIPHMTTGIIESVWLSPTEETPTTPNVTMVARFTKGKLGFSIRVHEKQEKLPVQVLNAKDLLADWTPEFTDVVKDTTISKERLTESLIERETWKKHPLLRGLQWLAEGENISMSCERKGDDRTIHLSTDSYDPTQKAFVCRIDGEKDWEEKLYVLTESDLLSNWKLKEIGEKV